MGRRSRHPVCTNASAWLARGALSMPNSSALLAGRRRHRGGGQRAVNVCQFAHDMFYHPQAQTTHDTMDIFAPSTSSYDCAIPIYPPVLSYLIVPLISSFLELKHGRDSKYIDHKCYC
eukprot:COSAG04_NODE_1571_length_6297_cov_5.394159_1_plen_118_part_00